MDFAPYFYAGGEAVRAEALAAYLPDIWARLHERPELAFEERETTALLRGELTAAGVELLPFDTPKTGLIACIRGEKPGPVAALRCDIDALPITEESGLACASRCPGKMHACGHDFHAAAMLGAALLLQERREQLCGTVKVILQPAEEIASGAETMLATGLLSDVRCFIGIHSYPAFAPGTLGIKEGPVMAAVDRFEITLRGHGAHAAQPQKGTDVITAQAALIQSLQTLVSRCVDPFDPVVLSVTHVSAGNTWNVLPETAYLEGTVRTLSERARMQLEQGLKRMAAEIAAAYAMTAEVHWVAGPPAVVNDAELCALARRTAQRMGLQTARQEDTMGGEDFSRYTQQAPGIFIRVGTGGQYPGHHSKFTVDPAALAPAAAYFAQLAEDWLAQNR